MYISSWLRQLSHHLFGPRPAAPRRGRRTPPLPCSVRPRLEVLEDRITPNTYTPTVFTDGVSSGGTVNTLRDAVLAANKDGGTDTDVIQLQAGTYTLSIGNTSGHETAGKEGDLNITNPRHSLIIQGGTDASGKPATILEQTAFDRVFEIANIVNPSTTVTFKNVVIEHGWALEDGGIATSTSTDSLGGGILDEGGNITLNNVVLQSNSALAPLGFDAAGGGIYVVNGSLTINNSVIQGNTVTGGIGGFDGTPSGSAEGGGVFFSVSRGTLAQLTITGSTVAHNTAGAGSADQYTQSDESGGEADGGGIYAIVDSTSSSQVRITASNVSGNNAFGGDAVNNGTLGFAFGGGAFFDGTNVQLVNSTIAENYARAGNGGNAPNETSAAGGGGLYFGSGGATLTNVTVARNESHAYYLGTAFENGGGIDAEPSATVALLNTLAALNSGGSNPDFYGVVSNSSHNLIGIAGGDTAGFSAAHGDLLGSPLNPLDPHLGPLQNNGGPTMTMALLSNSPAINAGDNNAQAVTGLYDQRGYSRVVGGTIDIGAFEYHRPPRPPGGIITNPPKNFALAPPPPPSPYQALLSLYLDGIELEAVEQGSAAGWRDHFAIASALEALLQFFGNPNLDSINADIAFNEPYAGPFGSYVVLAGELALLQTLQPS